jgi:hypothetical protein
MGLAIWLATGELLPVGLGQCVCGCSVLLFDGELLDEMATGALIGNLGDEGTVDASGGICRTTLNASVKCRRRLRYGRLTVVGFFFRGARGPGPR